MQYYVYYHVRLDTNRVFYVGKGKVTPVQKDHRARDTDSRNQYWKNIVNKTEWTYEIIKRFETSKEALKYETRLIQMFGVFYEGGQLCNIVKNSTEFEEYARLNNENMKKVFKYDLEGNFLEEYKSTKEAGKLNDCDSSSIAKVCRGIYEHCKEFRWSYEKTDKLPDLTHRIYQYSTSGEFLREFLNSKEARIFMGGNFDLEKACDGRIYTSKGYQWRYFKVDKLDEVIIGKHNIDKLKILLQYDLDMNLIASHKGYEAACKAVNATSPAIASALAGRIKTCKGFIWKYETKEKEC